MDMRCKTTAVQIQEKRWNEAPQASDYKYFRRLLQDFFINVDIPVFNTYKDLHAWAHRQINNI